MEIFELYTLARSGKKDYEEELFRQLLVRFRYLANCKVWNKQDAEEIVQSALLVIVREYCSLDGDRRFEPWAYTVLNNRILSYMKARRQADGRVTVFDEDTSMNSGINSDDQLKAKLRSCLAKIRKKNKNYARILSLHFQGYSTDEICRKLEINPNNLYVTLSRARTLLAGCLEGEDD